MCILNIKNDNSKYLISIIKYKMDCGLLEVLEEFEQKEINKKILKIINIKRDYIIISED